MPIRLHEETPVDLREASKLVSDRRPCYSVTQQLEFGAAINMVNREARTLSLTPEQATFLSTCVKSGRFQSASEVVRTALRLLEDQESARLAEREHIRGLVREGVAQIDRGDVVDGELVFRRLAEKHAKLSGKKPKR